MPIVDYEHIAKRDENNFFQDKRISDTNKAHVKKFLMIYDVSPARKMLFFRHIIHLFTRSKDIKKEMQDRDKINRVFYEFRKSLSPSYYATIINVSLRFVRWLNDGEKPTGFKDIRNIPKKKQLRDLMPEDMVTWKEGLKLAEMTHSVQIKAIVMSQLDGGFRPSEFVDLNYGDCTILRDAIIVRVRRGKTGRRDVVLFRAVPYLLRWLQAHPLKEKDSPLWLRESARRQKASPKGKAHERFSYSAIRFRVSELGRKVGLEKPLDFYNLRHSACTIAKKENTPVDIAAKKFGHSVEYYDQVYGRLSVEDDVQRLREHRGLKVEHQAVKNNLSCSRCQFVNEPGLDFCSQCSSPLTIEKALERDNIKELLERIKKMETLLYGKINEQMLEIIRKDATSGKVLLNKVLEIRDGKKLWV